MKAMASFAFEHDVTEAFFVGNIRHSNKKSQINRIRK